MAVAIINEAARLAPRIADDGIIHSLWPVYWSVPNKAATAATDNETSIIFGPKLNRKHKYKAIK